MAGDGLAVQEPGGLSPGARPFSLCSISWQGAEFPWQLTNLSLKTSPLFGKFRSLKGLIQTSLKLGLYLIRWLILCKHVQCKRKALSMAVCQWVIRGWGCQQGSDRVQPLHYQGCDCSCRLITATHSLNHRMCFQWQCKSQSLSLAIPLSWHQQVGLSILLNAKINKKRKRKEKKIRKYWQGSVCPLLAGQSFPEGLPWQPSLFLTDKGSATDFCVNLQPIQAKIFESFQKGKNKAELGYAAPDSISEKYE